MASPSDQPELATLADPPLAGQISERACDNVQLRSQSKLIVRTCFLIQAVLRDAWASACNNGLTEPVEAKSPPNPSFQSSAGP